LTTPKKKDIHNKNGQMNGKSQMHVFLSVSWSL